MKLAVLWAINEEMTKRDFTESGGNQDADARKSSLEGGGKVWGEPQSNKGMRKKRSYEMTSRGKDRPEVENPSQTHPCVRPASPSGRAVHQVDTYSGSKRGGLLMSGSMMKVSIMSGTP